MGTTPPKTKTLCQPQCGTSQAARKPPPAAPTVKPAKTMVTSSERRARGAYSVASVAAMGMMPPMASPAMKR